MASENVGSLVVRIETNLRNFNDGIENASRRVDGFGSTVKKIGGIIAGAFVVKEIANFGKQMITAASDAGEMQSKFNVVFDNMSSDAEAWAKDFRDNVGGSRLEIKGMLADSQDMLTGFGATTEQAFDFSTKMQALGTDLASFQNLQGGSAEAVERLRKGLLGETENLKAMGIVINETVMLQELASRGDDRKIKDLSELEKIELRYAIAVNQSKNAIGDAERTADGFANQMRNLKGQVLDAVASLGVHLLPIATKVVAFLNAKLPDIQEFADKGIQKIAETAEFLGENVLPVAVKAFNGLGKIIKFVSDNFNIFGPILAGITAALIAQTVIGGITKLYRAWQLATAAQTTAQWLLNAAMTANPFGLVAVAVGVLVAAGIVLYKNWDTVRINMLKIFDSISFKVQSAMSFMKIKVLEGINIVLKSVDKFAKFIPGLSDTVGKARDAISSMINAEKVNQDSKKFGHALNQASFAVQLQEIKLKKLETTGEDVTEATKQLTEAKKQEAVAMTKSTEATKKAEEAQKDLEEAQKKLREETVRGLGKLGDAVTKALTNRYQAEEKLQLDSLQKQTDNLRSQTDERLKEYDRELAAKLGLLDVETNEDLRALQDQIDNINDQTKSEEKALEKQAHAKRVADKEKELSEAETAEERAKIQQELNKILADRERKLLLESRQEQVNFLRDEMQRVRSQSADKKKALEEEFKEKKRIEEEKAKAAIEALGKEMDATKLHFANLLKEDNLQAEARILALDENNQELIDLLETYNPKWQDAGQSFGESMLDGLNSTKSSIQAAVNDILALIGGAPKTIPALSTQTAIDTSGLDLENEDEYLRNLIKNGNPGEAEWAKNQGRLYGLPGFDKGTNFVPFDTTAFLHKGEAVIPARNNPSNSGASNPVGGDTFSFAKMFEGAIFNVRSDNDIKLLAREIFNLQQNRGRSSGVVYGQ